MSSGATGGGKFFVLKIRSPAAISASCSAAPRRARRILRRWARWCRRVSKFRRRRPAAASGVDQAPLLFGRTGVSRRFLHPLPLAGEGRGGGAATCTLSAVERAPSLTLPRDRKSVV